MSNLNKKYKVYSIIEDLPKRLSTKAREELPVLLNISLSSFKRRMYATVQDPFSFTAEELFLVAQYLSVNPADLFEKKPNISSSKIKPIDHLSYNKN